jgi:hypothetical protein
MLKLPNRLETLRDRLEKGEIVTQKEVDDLARLQVLDIALLGRQALEEAMKREDEEYERIASIGDR